MEFKYSVDYSVADNSNFLPQLIDNIIARWKEIFMLEPNKQDVVFKTTSWNMACPYCGDSKKDSKKKRGWIYFKSFTFYKCWNCNVVKSLYSFIKDWNLESNINLGFVRQVDSSMSLSTTYSTGTTSDVAHDLEAFLPSMSEFYRSIPQVRPVDQDVQVLRYLQSRYLLGLPLQKFATDRYHNLYVLNTAMNDTKVLSYQVRYATPLNGVRWRTYSWEALNEKYYKKTVPEGVVSRLNKASNYYNILNIDPYKPVFITESAICSTHFPNGMASQGVGNLLKLPTGLYVPDNTTMDSAGSTLAIKLMQENLTVFLWKKFTQDYPHLARCKDVNEMVIALQGKWDYRILLPYFSKDSLDYFYL